MSRTPRLFASLVIAVGLAPVAGCIVLVDSFEAHEQCEIQGSGACATCIRSSCQNRIDDACRSTASGAARGTSILGEVDACGRGETTSCARALSKERSDEDEALRQCVQASCRSACTVPSSAGSDDREHPRWTCDAPRTDETQCEQCVHQECATKLDECCADDTCAAESNIQRDLGACFSGDPRACVWRFKDASADGTSGIVRQCVVDRCFEACLGDGRTHTSCTPRASGTYCTCTNAEKSSGPECSADKMNVDYCVIGRSGCTCGAFQMTSTTRSRCTADYYGGSQSHSDIACVPGSEGRCCLSLESDGVSCTCDTSKSASECLESEYAIRDCSESTIKEKLGGRIVPSCSL